MRKALAVLAILVCSATPSLAQVSLGFSSPGVSIGVNLTVYPDLVRIPGYPVYYAPSVNANYFFYDGLYWVFDGVNWYASTWYNGPWQLVTSDAVPLFLLRVPVRYYRERPAYFRGWAVNAAPRWDAHWGRTWAQRHRGWDRWNRASVPAPAPLPTYQRRYAGNRYPGAAEQRALEGRNYHYYPRDQVAQQHFRQGSTQRGGPPATAPRDSREQVAQQHLRRGSTQRGGPPATVQRVAPGDSREQVAQQHFRQGSTQRSGPPTTPQRAAPRDSREQVAQQHFRQGSTQRSEPRQRTAPRDNRERVAPPMARHAGPPAIANDARPAAPRDDAHASQGRGPQGRGPAQAANRGGNSGPAHAPGGERREEHNG